VVLKKCSSSAEFSLQVPTKKLKPHLWGFNFFIRPFDEDYLPCGRSASSSVSITKAAIKRLLKLKKATQLKRLPCGSISSFPCLNKVKVIPYKRNYSKIHFYFNLKALSPLVF
jgi:hypothetical protein